jgi:hypothetical protein
VSNVGFFSGCVVRVKVDLGLVRKAAEFLWVGNADGTGRNQVLGAQPSEVSVGTLGDSLAMILFLIK